MLVGLAGVAGCIDTQTSATRYDTDTRTSEPRQARRTQDQAQRTDQAQDPNQSSNQAQRDRNRRANRDRLASDTARQQNTRDQARPDTKAGGHTWEIGTLGPRESTVIQVEGRANQPGQVS